MTTRTLLFVFAFLLVVSLAHAGDERSIKNLAKALTGLASDVDPAEAQALSYTAHTTARRLKENIVSLSTRSLRCSWYNVGMRKRGWCGHWAQDIGARIDRTRASRRSCSTGVKRILTQRAKTTRWS